MAPASLCSFFSFIRRGPIVQTHRKKGASILIRKCYYVSEETDQKITELSHTRHLTKSQLIESLVTAAYSESQNESERLAEKIVTALTTTHLSILKTIVQDTNRNTSLILDMLNSFCSTIDSVGSEDFRSVEQNPHPWYAQSKQNLSDKILRAQRAAYPLQRGDEE